MRHNALLNDVSQLDVNVNKVNVWSTENVNHSALDRFRLVGKSETIRRVVITRSSPSDYSTCR